MTEVLFDALSVSRETMGHFEHYQALVKKWSKGINLVSATTQDHIWDRHILDSAQLFLHIPEKCAVWLDLGSGAGFPGLVISVLAKEHLPALSVYLIESDNRKCVFLRTVIRELSLAAIVVNDRIETAEVPKANVVSARALTGLVGLLGYAHPHMAKNGICLFQKGENWEKEVLDAEKQWSFDRKILNSKTQSGAVTLELGGIRRE